MIRAFLAWWGRQLLDVLPARWRRDGPAHETADALLLSLHDGSAVMDATRRRQRRTIPIGRFGLDATGLATLRAAIVPQRPGAVHLLLPPRLVLEQDTTLPLAAERSLDDALRWEMDRLTPFAVDAVFWSWQIQRRDRLRGTLGLRLRLVPKAAIASALDALAAAGLAPSILASAADPSRAVPLTRARPGWTSRGALLAAGLACAALLVAAVTIPFVKQSQALRRIDAEIASAKPDVDAAEALRRGLLDRAASAGVVAAEGARVGNVLRTLAAITDILPDNTYLFGLTLRDRTLTITGQSASAAKLIPAIAADPAFKNPVFAAPVTRNEMTSAEAFSIRAEVSP